MLTDAQLQALSRRALMAAQRGYTIARGDHYVAELAGEAGVSDAGVSAQDIADLCLAVIAKRAGKPVETSKPAPKAKEPEPETPAEDQTLPEQPVEEEPPADEEAPAEEPVAEPPAAAEEPEEEEEGGYETWTRDALYEEAKARGIEKRSEMNKAELIEALEASDKAD